MWVISDLEIAVAILDRRGVKLMKTHIGAVDSITFVILDTLTFMPGGCLPCSSL